MTFYKSKFNKLGDDSSFRIPLSRSRSICHPPFYFRGGEHLISQGLDFGKRGGYARMWWGPYREPKKLFGRDLAKSC